MKYLDCYRDLEETAFSGFDKEQMVGPRYFEKMVENAVRVAEERNVPLYCGEYGVIDRITPEDALRWYKMITACYDKFGIGRAAWTYREMDFGIVDARMDSVRDELVKLL